MYKLFKQSKISALFVISFLANSFLFADPTDGCELDLNTMFLTQEGQVLYNSENDIGGFQFNVDGDGEVLNASGGEAEAAGFTVSFSSSTVLGFSFTGGTVSTDCGTLTNLDLSGEASGLSGIVVSDAAGNSLDFFSQISSRNL